MSCSKAASRAPGRSAGSWARVIPTELPRRAGLTIRRGSPVPDGEGLELGEDAGRVARPAPGGDLAPVDDRQAEAAHEALEERLVHAERRGGHAGAGVRQVGRLEQGLDRAVLAEWPVEGDEHDRPGLPGGEALEDRAARQRALGAERGRIVEVGRGQAGLRAGGVRCRRASAPGSDHQRPSRSITTRSTAWPAAARAAATADPETIETSCSADGPPRRTTTGGPAAHRPPPAALGWPVAPVAEVHDLLDEPDARSLRSTSARTRSARRRRSVALPFRSLTRKLACFSLTEAPPIRRPFRPAASISAPAEFGQRVAEPRAGARGAQRLVRPGASA